MRPLALALALVAAPGVASMVQAHQLEHRIADCGCDAACYTNEVTNLSCDGRHITFQSSGFPDPAHTMMVGMTGTNQQFPRPHSYRFQITRTPEKASRPTYTEPGAIGVAVNGVPIFDPSTQGPIQASTGKPVSAREAGELDACGGHAGRGDDYHYHHAPTCLIEKLGREAVDVERRPIGWAADGYPILALGWFDRGNDIEGKLDECRGAEDAAGRYFYNVARTGDQDVLNCFMGTPRGFSRDSWDKRRDAAGAEIEGSPLSYTVTDYKLYQSGNDLCSEMSGRIGEARIVENGQLKTVRGVEGTLFYCSSRCYGHFVRHPDRGVRGMLFEAVTQGCPSDLAAAKSNAFLRYLD